MSVSKPISEEFLFRAWRGFVRGEVEGCVAHTPVSRARIFTSMVNIQS